MKKYANFAAAFAFCLCFCGNIYAYDAFEMNGTKYMGLREVCDELGFNIEWIGKEKTAVVLLNGNEQIKFKADYGYAALSYTEDGLTEDEYAYLELANVPLIEDGTMYIPVDELEFLKLYEGSNEADKALCTVLEVNDEGVLVQDERLGEVVLSIGSEAVITDETGNTASIEDIKEGCILEVIYGDTMTMSIPPINNPLIIKILQNNN